MDLRRRIPETVGAGATDDFRRRTPEPVGARDPLVERGLQLYEEAEHGGFTNKETLEKSLKFFVQAAEGGVDEATSWIESFLGSLSALPASVVLPGGLVKVMKWLTEATAAEKQIRNVAKTMFQKMADGKLSISKDEVDTSATKLLSSERSGSTTTDEKSGLVRSSKLLKGSVKRLMQEAVVRSENKEITEEAFCDVAVAYARGDLQSPNFLGAEELTEEQLAEFKKANLVKKVYEYPWQTLRYFKMMTLRQIERRGIKWVWSSFPTKQFYLLALAYLLPMLTVNFVVSTIATVLFFFSFTAMIFATLQLVLTSEQSFLMMEYSSIFQYFSEGGSSINIKVPESRLIRHAVGPYVAFLVALAIAVVTMGLAHQQVIVYELLTVASAIFSFGLFMQFEVYKSPLMLIVVLSRSIAWFYVILSMLQTYLPVPEFLFFASKSFISFPIFPSVWIGVNLISVLQFPIQFGTIVYLLYKQSWRNFFSGLGPVMLFLCWSVLCRNFLSFSNARYLGIAASGVFVVLASLPFLPVLCLLSPAMFFFYFGNAQPFYISLSFVIICSLLLLFVAANFKRIKEARWLNISLEYLLLLQIVLSVVFLLVGSSLYASMHKPGSLPVVTAQQYTNHCIPNQDGNANSVPTEINCIHLQGRVFEAEGKIGVVKIHSVINDHELSLKALPSPVKTALTCLFGSSKPMCGDTQDNPTCVYSGCNFQHSLQYVFDIQLTLPLTLKGYPITLASTLLASNNFLPAVLKLHADTILKFNATFLSGMGSTHLTLQAKSLVLPNGEVFDNSALYNEDEEREFLFSRFVRSLQNTVYLLLEMLFGYTKPINVKGS